MRIVALNGSARRNMNTATLIEHAARGAAEAAGSAARVDIVQLYPMKYTGCTSCLFCKRPGAMPGKCAVNDSLTPILEQAAQADVVILGTPVHFFRESAASRCFLERFLFPWKSYAKGMPSLSDKLIPVGLIYSMNVEPQHLENYGMSGMAAITELFSKASFGHAESLMVFNTMQVRDYDKYEMGHFDAGMKKKNYEENFVARDCKNAFDLGGRLARKAAEAGEKGLSPKSQASLARSDFSTSPKG